MVTGGKLIGSELAGGELFWSMLVDFLLYYVGLGEVLHKDHSKQVCFLS